MKSTKLMFLGFLIILVGIGFLISLGSAIPPNAVSAGPAATLNPLVDLFSPQQFNGATTDYFASVAGVIRAEESFAFIIILVGLIIGVVGYFQKE